MHGSSHTSVWNGTPGQPQGNGFSEHEPIRAAPRPGTDARARKSLAVRIDAPPLIIEAAASWNRQEACTPPIGINTSPLLGLTSRRLPSPGGHRALHPPQPADPLCPEQLHPSPQPRGPWGRSGHGRAGERQGHGESQAGESASPSLLRHIHPPHQRHRRDQHGAGRPRNMTSIPIFRVQFDRIARFPRQNPRSREPSSQFEDAFVVPAEKICLDNSTAAHDSSPGTEKLRRCESLISMIRTGFRKSSGSAYRSKSY